MARLVNITPSITLPSSREIAGLSQQTVTMGQTLYRELADHAQRLNLAFMRDGTERMEAPIPLDDPVLTSFPSANLWEGSIIYGNDTNLVYYSNGVSWIPISFRTRLTSGTTINFGAAQAYTTIQAAWNYLIGSVDTAGFNVVFQEVGGATYTTGLLVTAGWTGGGSVTIKGTGIAGTHFNISTAGAVGFNISRATLPGLLAIQDMKITCSGLASDGIRNQGVGHVDFANINFDPVEFAVTALTAGAEVAVNGNCTVSPTTVASAVPRSLFGLAFAQTGGAVYVRGGTFTFVGGAPNFRAACLFADTATIHGDGANYPGSAGALGYGAWAQFRGDIVTKGTTPPGGSGVNILTGGTYN